MNLTKKILTMLLAICMCFSVMAVSAFAADLETDVLVFDNNETVVYQDDEVTITRIDDIQSSSISTLANTMTYESTWLKQSASGSFTVNTPNSGTIGITLKVESSSNSSFAYISVQKPNGDYFKNSVYVDPTTNNGDGAYYKMYFASSGNYTIHYTAYTDVGMRIMCWLY